MRDIILIAATFVMLAMVDGQAMTAGMGKSLQNGSFITVVFSR